MLDKRRTDNNKPPATITAPQKGKKNAFHSPSPFSATLLITDLCQRLSLLWDHKEMHRGLGVGVLEGHADVVFIQDF